MRKTLATVGWLMFASASFGSDGQHTGVGGNPAVPPPNPSRAALPPWTTQMIVIPGLVIVQPEIKGQDTSKKPEASPSEGQKEKDKASEPSAQ